MARYGLFIDVEKCTGCYSCFLACKDEYTGNDYMPLSYAKSETGDNWLRIKEVEHGSGTKVKVDYIPIMCQHCEEALCMNVAPEGAVYRREDGIVIIDPEKAKGCKDIVNACPYRAIYWNEKTELPQKCTMCAHMLDNGEKNVRCAEVCPTGAMVFGDMDDPNSKISKVIAEKAEKAEKVEVFKPEFGTNPVVKYSALPKPFIAGEVLLSDKKNDCAKGVAVTLMTKDGAVAAKTETDFFGDFEFKGLSKDVEYVLKADYKGYFTEELSVKTNASKNVGEIVLRAK